MSATLILPPDGRDREAVLALLGAGVLPDFAVGGNGSGALAVSLTRPLATYSTGEQLVWLAARSMLASCAYVDLYATAIRLDDEAKRAVLGALAVLYGVEQ